MRTVVAAFPDYLWGWTQLAEWLTAKGNLDEALEVTQSMIRLAPRSAVPLGYRADIQARLGQRRTAFETLQQAFDIDPTYDFAAYTIFDSQLQSRDVAAAEKTLKRIEMHLPGPRARAARVRLFCHKGKKKSALDEFRTICFLPVGDEAAIELAATALIAVQTSEPGTRREVYNRHKLLLRQSPRNILASSSVRPTAKRAVEAMAKAAGVQPFRLPGGNIAQGTGRDNTTRWYVIVAVVVISLIRGCVSMGPQSSTPSLPGGDPNAERNFSTPVDPTSQATPAFHFPGEISGTDIVKKGDD